MSAQYGKTYFVRRGVRPPRVYIISGTVTISGSPQANAVIYLIDENTDTLLSYTTTNAAGFYLFGPGIALDITHTYHVAAEYDDGGGNKYNAKSYPFITPYESS